jgi:hypothetical protein
MNDKQNDLQRSVEDLDALDAEIQEKQKITDHEIREYPVSVVVDKFVSGIETDDAEIFIPDYQREFVWDKKQQSRFIESVLLNIPVPYLFVADVAQGKYKGRLEIVDGSQRIRTLVSFVADELVLEQLKRLPAANGLRFSDLSAHRQMRFNRKTLRLIELTEHADEETRREIFDRLNTGGTRLNTMEQRRGSQDGKFLRFIDEIASMPLFREMSPISEARRKRDEYSEFVLRYFAYSNEYMNFDKAVDDFLTSYLKRTNLGFDETLLRAEFESMLKFVGSYFPNGFRKSIANASVPRIRFEAISVGVTLALRMASDLVPGDPTAWLESDEFTLHTRSDASNSRPKVRNRIHFVRDKLLGVDVEISA